MCPAGESVGIIALAAGQPWLVVGSQNLHRVEMEAGAHCKHTLYVLHLWFCHLSTSEQHVDTLPLTALPVPSTQLLLMPIIIQNWLRNKYKSNVLSLHYLILHIIDPL